MIGFKQLLKDIPIDARILDVGAWGVYGENTSTHLKYFEDVVYMNTKPLAGVTLVQDFYDWTPDGKFDLIVLDLNIENNISRDWTREGMGRVYRMLNEGGSLILYVLTKDGYTEEEPTKTQLDEKFKEYWKSSPVTIDAIGDRVWEMKFWELYGIQPDDHRNNIAWVRLTKI